MNAIIAAIQMNSQQDLSTNLLAAKKSIQEAAEKRAKLVVLPEMFAVMGQDQTDKIKYKETKGRGPIQDFLSEMAKTYSVWIVGGTIPIAIPDEENKIYASSLLINDQGERVAYYNKIHLFDVTLKTKEAYFESKTTKPGDQIIVQQTPFGKLGLAVCYDVRFPELFRKMLDHGVEIIALPAAFTYTTGVAHWEILVRARAIENLSYVIAACQTGLHNNVRKTFGSSMIVNPWGEIMTTLPDEVGVITAEINLEKLHQLRQEFPALSHRK